MNITELKEKFIWQMTGEEFLFLQQNGNQNVKVESPTVNPNKKYVYGLHGIAQLFGCSMPTTNRIKKSSKIDRTVTQIERIIIVDAEYALELAGRKTDSRK